MCACAMWTCIDPCLLFCAFLSDSVFYRTIHVNYRCSGTCPGRQLSWQTGLDPLGWISMTKTAREATTVQHNNACKTQQHADCHCCGDCHRLSQSPSWKSPSLGMSQMLWSGEGEKICKATRKHFCFKRSRSSHVESFHITRLSDHGGRTVVDRAFSQCWLRWDISIM